MSRSGHVNFRQGLLHQHVWASSGVGAVMAATAWCQIARDTLKRQITSPSTRPTNRPCDVARLLNHSSPAASVCQHHLHTNALLHPSKHTSPQSVKPPHSEQALSTFHKQPRRLPSRVHPSKQELSYHQAKTRQHTAKMFVYKRGMYLLITSPAPERAWRSMGARQMSLPPHSRLL